MTSSDSGVDDGSDGPVTEAELHAWMDGELPPGRRAAVERHLAEHPEDGARLESYRRAADLIAGAYAPLATMPAPDAPPGQPWSWRPVAAVAAALLLFVAGGATGWMVRGVNPAAVVDSNTQVAREAATAHSVFAAEVRHPVEVAADQEAHLVTWLSRRLGEKLTAPQLAPLGFELMGGRLLSVEQGPAAQLMYQDRSGRRLTVYLRRCPVSSDTAFRIAEVGRVTALYWHERGVTWAIAGDVDRALLQDAAHRVYAAFNS